MLDFIVGFVCGIIVATIGFTGIASTLDKGVDAIKGASIAIEKKK